MNGNTDFDRIAQSWLQDGPTEMPDRSLQAALDEVHVTSQQRFGAARRTFNMNGNAFRLAAGAAVGLLIFVAGGIYLGNNSSGGVGGTPAATPSPTSTPAPLPSEGVIQPGRYRLGSKEVSVPATMSITVPSGWSAGGAITKNYGSEDAADAGPALGEWQISNRFNDACTDHTLFEPAPGPGIDELLATLASQPGIEAGPITDVTVFGYRGKSVELTVATDIATCPVDSGNDPLSGFWLWASPDGDRRYVQGSDEMDRIYAVDVDGTRFTFFARIPARTTAADRAELQAVIDSIGIEPTAASPSPSGASPSP